MIRLAHIADLHFDERNRMRDLFRVLSAFVVDAQEQQADVILIAGDVFERKSSPQERLAFAEFLLLACQVAPVFVVRGNHDAPGDLDLFTFCGATILVGPTVSMPIPILLPHCPTMHLFALPWFSKEHVVAALGAEATIDETRTTTIEVARNLLDVMRATIRESRHYGAVPLVLGHVQVAGSEVSTGQTLIGQSVELAPNDLLELGASYCALGHIHKRQAWFDGRVAYSGSPQRCNFGEPEEKGWNLVTLDDAGGFVSNEFRPLPARRIVTVDLDPTERPWVTQGQAETFKDALVRIRARVPASLLHQVDRGYLEKMTLDSGAEDVTIEVIVHHETRQRAPEITTVTSVADKVETWAKAKGLSDDKQLARLREKVGILEGETDAP